MPILQALTKLDTYKTYMQDIGENRSYHLENCFSSGMASVWLYMKAIGLEAEFFTLLAKAKDRPMIFKELLYLLQLSTSNSDYFPKVPKDLLKLEIPGLVADAQVEITQPDFKLVFEITRDRLSEVLRSLAVNHRMIRIGDKQRCVGIVFSNNKYCVYHSGNSTALEYDKLNDCVDAVMRVFKGAANV